MARRHTGKAKFYLWLADNPRGTAQRKQDEREHFISEYIEGVDVVTHYWYCATPLTVIQKLKRQLIVKTPEGETMTRPKASFGIPTETITRINTRTKIIPVKKSDRPQRNGDLNDFFHHHRMEQAKNTIPKLDEANNQLVSELKETKTVLEEKTDVPKVGNIPGFFVTPPEVASRAVELLEITSTDAILDPCAGSGAFPRAILERHPEAHDRLSCYEINVQLQTILRERGYKVIGGDCFDAGNRVQFSKIIMDPPFENDQPVYFIYHRYMKRFLGGNFEFCQRGNPPTPLHFEKILPRATKFYFNNPLPAPVLGF